MREIPTQKTIKLNELSELKLVIPVYQRPYKWTEKNVLQLLEDIFEYIIVNNTDYRIGNIILHSENETNNVVDGQQRLTTISILLKVLDSSFEGLLLNQEYKNNISKNNIVYNYRIIDKWVNSKFLTDENKSDFKAKMLEKCELFFLQFINKMRHFNFLILKIREGDLLNPSIY